MKSNTARASEPISVSVKAASRAPATGRHRGTVEAINSYAEEVAALRRSQAVIEFDPDGSVLAANGNFLNIMGYTFDEIRGKHHSMFIEPRHRSSAEYHEFWAKLRQGEFQAAEFHRLAKGGREVWIQATYNPVLDQSGTVTRVVKYATDITDRKLAEAGASGQLAAISKSQAVIEFELDGTIIAANSNFLAVTGYSLADIQGRHHSLFVEKAYGSTEAYRDFWAKLKRGEFVAGEFKRIAKGGKEVWIQASYNPILGFDGKPFKVVKYATDITAQKLAVADSAGQLDAISKAQAVIEFDLTGRILTANDNFLRTVGYTLGEIQGGHHSMFVDESCRSSAAYREFGPNSAVANTTQGSTGALARAARRSGYRHPTTRFST